MKILCLNDSDGGSEVRDQVLAIEQLSNSSSHIITHLDIQDIISLSSNSQTPLDGLAIYKCLELATNFNSLIEADKYDLVVFIGGINWQLSYIALLQGVSQIVLTASSTNINSGNQMDRNSLSTSEQQLRLRPDVNVSNTTSSHISVKTFQEIHDKGFDSVLVPEGSHQIRDSYWNVMPSQAKLLFDLPHEIDKELVWLRKQEAMIASSFERRLGSSLLYVPRFVKKILSRIGR